MQIFATTVEGGRTVDGMGLLFRQIEGGPPPVTDTLIETVVNESCPYPD